MMDIFNDYLNDAIAAGEFNLDDIGSLIALAILESDGDRLAGIDALNRAKRVFGERSTVDKATDAFDAAIHHLESWDV